MKLAIVHDYLNQSGGAEKVVEVFHEMFPDAPIYTSIYDPKSVSPVFKDADIRVSFMQKLPMIMRHARRYLALYPYAFELFDLTDYDVVLSSSSAFAKGIITKPETCHICYCYTPMRFVWQYHSYMNREKLGCMARTFLPYIIHRLRRWDEITANRVDNYIAISSEVQKRIRKYYKQSSTIIHPPVDTGKFPLSRRDDGYFFVMSRLLPYKKIDIVIEAFNRMKLPLKIAGSGRDMARLKSMAGPTVQVLGRLSDDDLAETLGKCRALIFPGCEDFGLTPVEAMSAGKPVIAFSAGGALDTVINGYTGTFFYEQTTEAVMKAVRDFRPSEFSPESIRAHAATFDVDIFKQKLLNFIREKYEEHQDYYDSLGETAMEAVAAVRYPAFSKEPMLGRSLEDE